MLALIKAMRTPEGESKVSAWLRAYGNKRRKLCLKVVSSGVTLARGGLVMISAVNLAGSRMP